MAGRKPTPTELKKLAGNPGKRALPGDNPKPAVGLPPMPRKVLPKAGIRLWREIGKLLAANGLITEVDGPAFTMLAMHYGMAVEAMETLQAEGMIVDRPKYGQVAHPAMRILIEQSKAFRQYASEFGLTPASRSKLHVESEKERSLADILFMGVEEADEEGERKRP